MFDVLFLSFKEMVASVRFSDVTPLLGCDLNMESTGLFLRILAGWLALCSDVSCPCPSCLFSLLTLIAESYSLDEIASRNSLPGSGGRRLSERAASGVSRESRLCSALSCRVTLGRWLFSLRLFPT